MSTMNCILRPCFRKFQTCWYTRRLYGAICPLNSGNLTKRLDSKSPFSTIDSKPVACNYSSYVYPSLFKEITVPEVPLHTFVFEAQQNYGRLPAITDGVMQYSFSHGEIYPLAKALASGLAKLGVTKGSVVGIFAPNCPEYPVAVLAVSLLGAVCTPVSAAYTPGEVARQLDDSRTEYLIYHQLLHPIVKGAEALYSSLKVLLVIGPGPSSTVCVSDLFKDDGSALPRHVQVNPREDVILMPYSSGTSGKPKGVCLTHYNIVANILQILHDEVSLIKKHVIGDPHQDTLLGMLPFFHVYGLVSCLLCSLYLGSHIVTLPRFDPHFFIQTVKSHRMTFLPLVPPLVSFLVHNPQVTPDILQHLKSISVGAAPLGKGLAMMLTDKFPWVKIQEGYGLTETSPVTHFTQYGDYVSGSCGQAVANTWTKITDLSTGVSLAPGKEGELCIKGPQVMKEYLNNPEATREVIDAEGWFHTGDIGMMDDKQNMFIIDRVKELIKVKGMQVAPAELEDILRRHRAVMDVAVIGIPSLKFGEVPRGYIVLKPEFKQCVRPDEIVEWLVGQVAHHKELAGGVEFVDEIPKNPTGKILRRVLRESYSA